MEERQVLIGRQQAIDTEGLDAQIRCEMCRNLMHTDRGCDGHCKYDEKLYERIIQILDKRITPLPSADPEPSQLAKDIARILENDQDMRVILKNAESEIVRCKDCKHKPSGDGVNHHIAFPDGRCPCQCDDYWYSWIPDDDWFCGNAERREDGKTT